MVLKSFNVCLANSESVHVFTWRRESALLHCLLYESSGPLVVHDTVHVCRL